MEGALALLSELDLPQPVWMSPPESGGTPSPKVILMDRDAAAPDASPSMYAK
ncbi:hypothetical protein ANN_05540 [Periplaneta americana]|uniref:Uncharacterized protein n=1 Tax=Periplaneta americana TaxID=6978 RepID=A0ABQ8TD87_PERAM|nr:hypothetical protein ANN_05540 [Periplaneta americana]